MGIPMDTYHEVIRLNDSHRLSQAEIGRRTGISKATVALMIKGEWSSVRKNAVKNYKHPYAVPDWRCPECGMMIRVDHCLRCKLDELKGEETKKGVTS